MKQFLMISTLLMILAGAFGCNKFIFKKQEKQVPPEEIETAVSYLDMAENMQTAEDTVNVESYYFLAWEKLDSLSTIYVDDSTIVDLQAQVSQSYDDYLDHLAGIEEDTLALDWVLRDLDALYADLDSLLADTVSLEKIPLVTNKKVERAIKYFTTGRGRKTFYRWLVRAGRYESMVKKILREEKAPEDLFYLAMIESGLNPRARSYARAVGMWQFIYATGKAYGLTSSWWYDDRRDPVKATHAAARHLLDLYDRFGDWYLAAAGYNFNPRKIERRMEKYKVDEFWDLPRLPRQTRNYVPTYLAAVTIAAHPEEYGFGDIVPDNPIEFDTVTVSDCVDLNVVAEIVNSNFKELKDLNPAILRWCTPPDRETWLLNLPAGTRDTFLDKYAEIPKEKKMSWVHHRIRSGETLSTIAQKYRVSVAEIRRFNNLKGSFIRAGQNLVIPIPQDKKYYQKYLATQSKPRRKSTTYRKPSAPVANVPGREKHVYTVKKGDSLWDIAVANNVTITEIRNWNGLGSSRLIKPGQQLNIWLPPGGQTAASGSAQLAASTNPPTAQNTNSAAAGEQKAVIHTVRSGDTLWDIAQAYNVSIRDIKRWNGMSSNKIKPGEELKILQD